MKMTQSDQQKFDTPRSSPRANAALKVEVEVSGQKQKVLLVTRDIGAGGMFLRTQHPAPLWSRVKLSFPLSNGELFEVSGEVVRSIKKKQAEKTGYPTGMAIAFDDVSRAHRKELVNLVLELCSKRPEKTRNEQATSREKPSPDEQSPAREGEKVEEQKEEGKEGELKENDTDSLLEELDTLLDSVEDEIDKQPEPDPQESEAEIPEIVIDDEVDEGSLDDIEIDIDAQEPVDAGSEHAEPEAAETSESGQAPVEQDQEARLRQALDAYRSSLSGDTYYDLLRIDHDAGNQAIETAYRKLLAELKPPAPPDSLSSGLLQDLSSVLGRIRKAFAILSKPDRKRAYDFLIDNNNVEDL